MTGSLIWCSHNLYGEKCSKHYITKNIGIDITNIKEINNMSNANITVNICEKGKEKIIISAPDNVIDYFFFKTTNGTLGIKMDFDKIKKISNIGLILISIDMSEIESLTINHTGSITVKDEIKTDSLNLKISSTGNIITNKVICTNLLVNSASNGNITLPNVECKSANVFISSCGNVSMKGSTTTLIAETISCGNINAFDFICEDVTAKTTSNGNINCYAKDKISVVSNSVGIVKYKGNPNIKNINAEYNLE
jgi:hypothetical protein